MKKPLKIAIIVAPVLALAGIGATFALNPPIVKQESKPVASVAAEPERPETVKQEVEVIEKSPVVEVQTEPTPASNPEPTPAPYFGLRAGSDSTYAVYDPIRLMDEAGIAPSDRQYVTSIVTRWVYRGKVETNLCNVTPSSKMSNISADYETNPVTQMKWCNWYAITKHGSWQNAAEYYAQHRPSW